MVIAAFSAARAIDDFFFSTPSLHDAPYSPCPRGKHACTLVVHSCALCPYCTKHVLLQEQMLIRLLTFQAFPP